MAYLTTLVEYLTFVFAQPLPYALGNKALEGYFERFSVVEYLQWYLTALYSGSTSSQRGGHLLLVLHSLVPLWVPCRLRAPGTQTKDWSVIVSAEEMLDNVSTNRL